MYMYMYMYMYSYLPLSTHAMQEGVLVLLFYISILLTSVLCGQW